MSRAVGVNAWMLNERDTQFIACHRAGMSLPQLAERFNITSRSAGRWRVRLGLNQPAAAAHPMSDRERAEQLLDDGCSFNEAARTVGVSRATIRRWFPYRHGWSKQEASEYAVLVRTLGRAA